MMSRDVMGRQMFANGGPAVPQPEMGMDQMAMMAQEQGVDPAQLQGALEMAQGQMQQIDNAENYEQVINGIRGDQQPLEARYAELTSVVGQEDSQATPESVLTLLQPVMQMAAVDQGIGGLAAEEMTAPIEGPMAEGIMSTVGMGEPDPVNFSQGGPVIHMAEGGEPSTYENKLNNRYQAISNVMANILGTEDREAALADQKRMTKAQMLFDIAQGGLALASPTDRNMSFAERLASSFNPVVGNIGARAGEFQKFKQGQEAEQRALDLQALGQAQSELSAEEARAFQAELARRERLFRERIAGAKPPPKVPFTEKMLGLLANPTFMEAYGKNLNPMEDTEYNTQNIALLTDYLTREGALDSIVDSKGERYNIYNTRFSDYVIKTVQDRKLNKGAGPTGKQWPDPEPIETSVVTQETVEPRGVISETVEPRGVISETVEPRGVSESVVSELVSDPDFAKTKGYSRAWSGVLSNVLGPTVELMGGDYALGTSAGIVSKAQPVFTDLQNRVRKVLQVLPDSTLPDSVRSSAIQYDEVTPIIKPLDLGKVAVLSTPKRTAKQLEGLIKVLKNRQNDFYNSYKYEDIKADNKNALAALMQKNNLIINDIEMIIKAYRGNLTPGDKLITLTPEEIVRRKNPTSR